MALIGTARHILRPNPLYMPTMPPSRQTCRRGRAGGVRPSARQGVEAWRALCKKSTECCELALPRQRWVEGAPGMQAGSNRGSRWAMSMRVEAKWQECSGGRSRKAGSNKGPQRAMGMRVVAGWRGCRGRSRESEVCARTPAQ